MIPGTPGSAGKSSEAKTILSSAMLACPLLFVNLSDTFCTVSLGLCAVADCVWVTCLYSSQPFFHETHPQTILWYSYISLEACSVDWLCSKMVPSFHSWTGSLSLIRNSQQEKKKGAEWVFKFSFQLTACIIVRSGILPASVSCKCQILHPSVTCTRK